MQAEGPYPWQHSFFCTQVTPGHWSSEPSHTHEEERADTLAENELVDGIKQRLASAELKVSTNANGLNALDARIDALAERIAAIEEKLT